MLQKLEKFFNRFHCYVGVDQTGATLKSGQPKSLPISVIFSSGSKIVHQSGKIASLTKSQLNLFLKTHNLLIKNKKTLVCVDAVLGLPLLIDTPMRSIIQKSKLFEFNRKPYGALTAHAFFSSYLKEEVPQRAVEKLVKANSVFALKPYQRNIGCGSYRIIKDLAENPNWYSIWPFEKPARDFVIAEGYPSYLWKNLFGSKTRDLDFINSKLKMNFKNIDEADSFVLALGAAHFEEQIFLKTTPTLAKKEGWILGVPF